LLIATEKWQLVLCKVATLKFEGFNIIEVSMKRSQVAS